MSSLEDLPDERESPKKRRSLPAWLASLGPEVQGDVDETLLRENLELSPFERLNAASEAAAQIEHLQRAMKAAGNA